MIKDTAQFFHGELERNWACHEDPHYTQRRDNIKQMTTTLHRVVEGKMLAIARTYPEKTSKLLRRSVPDGLKLSGAGSAHTVVSDGNTALKIHRMSVFMDDYERADLCDTMRHDHRLIQNYLGQIVVSQSTRVRPNPLQPKKQAAVSTQPHIDFEDLGLFDGFGGSVNVGRYEEATQRHAGIDEPLRDLAAAGIKMYYDTGYLPDTSGLNNIVISDGELKCLDGLPVHTNKAVDVKRITSQLHALLDLTQ